MPWKIILEYGSIHKMKNFQEYNVGLSKNS